MSMRISFEADDDAVEEAQLLSIEQGVTVEEIAAEAFSSYMAGVKQGRLQDVDDTESGSA